MTKARKIVNIKKVVQNNANWVEAFIEAARGLPTGRYTGEAVRIAVRARIGEPNHPNAWGGAFHSLLRRTGTMFRPLSKLEAMTSRSSHARLTRVYTKRR